MSAHADGFRDRCLPTRVTNEIKHDGYRLMLRRSAEGVRINTRRGYDCTDRFALITEAADRLRASSFGLKG